MVRESRTTVGYLGSEPLGEDRFGRALERANGVTVEAITESEAASDRRDAIDCLVCSHDEGVDGVALLETVRAQDRRLPVVLIAGPADGSAVSRAVAAGLSGFVPRNHDDATRILLDRIETVTEPEPPSDGVGASRMPIEALDVRDELRVKERAMDAAPVGITISDPDRPDTP